MMIVVELLIVALILAAEEIETHEKQPAPAPVPAKQQRPVAWREEEEAAPVAVIEREEIEMRELSYAELEHPRTPSFPACAKRIRI